jgi:hypothetical protein
MSSSPVPLVEIKDAVIEINNGIPYSDKNLGPVINIGDLAQFVKSPELKNGTYRISALNFFLLYTNYIGDKTEMKTFFDGLRLTHECIISHNHGNTYVFLNFGNSKGSVEKAKPFIQKKKVIDIFDYKDLHPEIFTFTSSGIKYCKEWIERADPMFVPSAKERKNIFDQLKDCKTKTEVLKKCFQASDVSGKLQAFDCIQEEEKKILDPYILTYKIWGWQIAAYQKLLNQPEERTIWWWWNNIPKLGKSMFGYWLQATYPAYFHTIADPTTKDNMMHRISQAIKGGWLGHCLILNLTMSFTGKEHLYTILECIKDSIVSSFKYNGSNIAKGPSHLVVFSNFEPFPYDKEGTPLIDRNRLQVVKIPVFSDIIDPNPPRPQLRVEAIKAVDIRPEDQRVIDACNAAIKSGSTIKFIQKDDKGKPVPPNGTKDAMNLKVEMPAAIPLPEEDIIIHTPSAPIVAEIVKKFEKKPPRDYSWKIYLNKEEGSLNSKGVPIDAKDILLHKGVSVGKNDIIVCRENEYKNYKLFAVNGVDKYGSSPIRNFYENYYAKLPEPERCLFEVITDRLQKIYFDIDIPYNMTEFHEMHLIAQIQIGILKAEPKIKKENIMTFSSHGPSKRSYHIVVDKFFVTNNYANQDFFLEVKSYVDPHLQAPMDPSVYKKVQQLRMYGCQKYDTEKKTGCGRFKILAKQNTWVNEEKEERLKELTILRASLITHDTGCELLRRKIEEKPGYEGISRAYSTEETKKIKDVVKEKFGTTFEYYGENKNSLIFKRNNPSMCPIHNRVHDHQNISIYVKNSNNKIYYRCFNIKKEDPVKEFEIGVL